MARVPGGFGVRRPNRSVSLERPLQDASTDTRLLERAAELAEELESVVGRMPPGSFTLDPGMRAADEFTDVTSPGYREHATRVAERGGAKEYATSVEEEKADAEADTLRNRIGMALASMAAIGMGTNAALGFGAARTAGASGSMALREGGRAAMGMEATGVLGPKVFWRPNPVTGEMMPHRPPPAPTRSYEPKSFASIEAENAARTAWTEQQVLQRAQGLRAGRGPGAQPAVPARSIREPAIPAVRDPGSPPPLGWQGSVWEWQQELARRLMQQHPNWTGM